MTVTGSGGAVPASERALAEHAFMKAAERTTTLYALSAEYLQVLEMLEATDQDDQLELELDSIAGAISQKAEAIAGLVAHLDYVAAARKAEAKRLRERAEADERHAERLRNYVFTHMKLIGTERIETTRFTLAIKTNPPSVEIFAEDQIPLEFIRVVTTRSVDKRAILEEVRATGVIPDGVEIVRKQRLDIR